MPDTALFAEDLGGLLALLSFFGFGAILLGPLMDDVTWQALVYAALSLTLVRMLPVVVSLLGTGLSRPTLVFAGWFGPRGLASIVFGLFVAEEALLDGSVVLQAVFVTVALSVVLHGVTAVWGANRYGTWFDRAAASGVPCRRVTTSATRRSVAGCWSTVCRWTWPTRPTSESPGCRAQTSEADSTTTQRRPRRGDQHP